MQPLINKCHNQVKLETKGLKFEQIISSNPEDEKRKKCVLKSCHYVGCRSRISNTLQEFVSEAENRRKLRVLLAKKRVEIIRRLSRRCKMHATALEGCRLSNQYRKSQSICEGNSASSYNNCRGWKAAAVVLRLSGVQSRISTSDLASLRRASIKRTCATLRVPRLIRGLQFNMKTKGGFWGERQQHTESGQLTTKGKPSVLVSRSSVRGLTARVTLRHDRNRSGKHQGQSQIYDSEQCGYRGTTTLNYLPSSRFNRSECDFSFYRLIGPDLPSLLLIISDKN
ncbi:hypothetical protein TcasGA2_TC007386 [Tribolium castaneum]|uniref:Uncharacterized protein n=1 Tax=Tribolium castaneum TaxID=7070 RepID=D1ZZW2_TRICA|nr:hypothetical protein TcasGA2_TC007386 [Tribolium castaneum]